MIKRLALGVAVLVLLAAAFYAGMSQGWRTAGKLGELTMVSWRAQAAFLEYQQGRDETAERGLLDFIDLLKTIHTGDDRLITESSAAGDMTLSYVRLAKIRSRRGDTAKAQDDLRQAEERCKVAQWTDCSEAHLRDVTEQIDRSAALTSK